MLFPARQEVIFAGKDYQNYNPRKKGESPNGSLSSGAYGYGAAGSATGSITIARFRVFQNEDTADLYNETTGPCPLCFLSRFGNAHATAAASSRQRDMERGGFA